MQGVVEQPARRGIDSWLIALAAAAFLLVVLAARYLSDADLGYHLAGGRWILEHLSVPSKDIFTFTRSDADYVDMHWLYQVIVYATFWIGGYLTLSLLNVALVAAVF